MREIISRGPEANTLLLSRVDCSIRSVGNGIGSVPTETFFCYAGLGAHPDTSMLPTLERLFELEDQASREVVGDLADDFSVKLVAGMADADNVDSIFHWIDTLIQNPNVEPAATYQWPRALQLWVRAELFTREAAIEHLKRWILQRSGESQDTFSGFCICEFVFAMRSILRLSQRCRLACWATAIRLTNVSMTPAEAAWTAQAWRCFTRCRLVSTRPAATNVAPIRCAEASERVGLRSRNEKSPAKNGAISPCQSTRPTASMDVKYTRRDSNPQPSVPKAFPNAFRMLFKSL